MDQTITLTSAANRVVSAIVAGLERQTVTPNLLRQFRAGDLELSAQLSHNVYLMKSGAAYYKRRFKPVVRVKMGRAVVAHD